MRKSIGILALLGGGLLNGTVIADLATAQASGCMACHQVEVKVVGPAYRDVAAKYKGDAGAKAMLIGKVRSGGSGVWGQIPMPPNSIVSDADLEKVIDWVLSIE